MPETTYSIGDLARVGAVTPRTVRYYVASGLLPGPVGAGPGARYTESHLGRLRLIRRLQREHLPLSEIQVRLDSLTDRDVAALVAEPDAPPPGSALDYIRAVLGGATGRRQMAAEAPAMPATRAMFLGGHVEDAIAPALAAAPPAGLAGLGTSPTAGSDDRPGRSQWDRIPLTSNVELHVRRPLSRLENRRVERLITVARQVLQEDQP